LTDAGCSQTSNAVVINVVATGPLGAATITPVAPVCKNGTLTLTSSNVGATAYNWTGPGGFTASGLSVNRTNFQPEHAGRYDLEVIVGTCVAEQLSILVDVVDVPSLAIQLEGADIICSGNSKTLSFLPNVSGFSIQWAKTTTGNIAGATGATFSANESANYVVKLKSTLNASCPEIVSPEKKLRVVNPPVVDFTVPATICAGSVTTLTDASTTDPDPQDPVVFYNWNFGDGGTATDKNPQHTFAAAQTYNVELTVSYRNNSCPASLQKSVTVTTPPTVQITNPDGMSSVCVGSTMVLEVLGNFTSYVWSTGETTPSIEIDTPGTYSVEVNAGCIITAEKVIGSLPRPIVSASATPRDINVGDVVALSATGLSDYTWSPTDGIEFPNQANTNATPPGNIVYTVSGRNSNGCYAEATVTITLVGGGSIDLLKPENYFTPNGDTFNPVWEVENAPVLPQCGVTIFDELGIKVFEAKPYNNDWDGTSTKGTKLPGGVYFYIIRCDDADTILKGSINLIR
jgi:gliding motility-associated-like protein